MRLRRSGMTGNAILDAAAPIENDGAVIDWRFTFT
jgi:hypothetical protein